MCIVFSDLLVWRKYGENDTKWHGGGKNLTISTAAEDQKK
jgi:hypothetical protein